MSQETASSQKVERHPTDLIFIQSRAEINDAIVEEYAAMMANGVIFDPIEGVQDESGAIFIFDGQHRGEAAKRVDTTLPANLRPGSQTEAEWLALTANQKHGLRRTRADKQHVVRKALLHPNGASLTDRKISRHCGVDHKTVAKIRQELVTSGEIPQITKRTVTRGGVTYQQETSGIGQSYVSVHDLEQAVKTWLSTKAETMIDQISLLAAIKDKSVAGVDLLDELLAGESLPESKRKRDVIQACNNVLEQLRQQLPHQVSPEGLYASGEPGPGEPELGESELGEPALREPKPEEPEPEELEADDAAWDEEPQPPIAGDVPSPSPARDRPAKPSRAQRPDASNPHPTTTYDHTVPALPEQPPLPQQPQYRQPNYQQPKRQEFECPRCGQERIVGVNGSRRWCLNCLAEWPTADAFLAEVNKAEDNGGEDNEAEDNQDPTDNQAPTLDHHLPSRDQLKDRFWNILARLDEQDPQLDQIDAWLDDLEDHLDFSPALDVAEDALSQAQIQP